MHTQHPTHHTRTQKRRFEFKIGLEKAKRTQREKNWLGLILNNGKLDHKNKTLKCSFVTIKYIVGEKHLAITMDFACWTTE